MTGLGDLAEHVKATSTAVTETPRRAARAVGTAGKNVIIGEATRRWGSDRRWSGAVRSRKKSASRQASARYDIADNGNRIEWMPTGTPFMVTIKGRRADDRRLKPKYPATRFATPDGPRMSQKRVTAMAPKGNIIAPIVPRIERDAVAAFRLEWLKALGHIYTKAG